MGCLSLQCAACLQMQMWSPGGSISVIYDILWVVFVYLATLHMLRLAWGVLAMRVWHSAFSRLSGQELQFFGRIAPLIRVLGLLRSLRMLCVDAMFQVRWTTRNHETH